MHTPLTRLHTSVWTTTWQLLEAWQWQEDHPNILVRDQRRTVWISLYSWIGAADCFSACMDTKVDSMMDRLEKRIDERIGSKLGPVMDRLSALEKTNSSTRSGPSSSSDNGGSAGQNGTMVAAGHRPRYWLLLYLEIKGWRGFRDKKHTWFDGGSGQKSHYQTATGTWT